MDPCLFRFIAVGLLYGCAQSADSHDGFLDEDADTLAGAIPTQGVAFSSARR